MVGADLECLVSPHDQASLAVLLVFQQSHVTSASLLPLSAISIKLEELGSHLESLFLSLFVCLGIDLLSESDDGLEVDIGLLFFGVSLDSVSLNS